MTPCDSLNPTLHLYWTSILDMRGQLVRNIRDLKQKRQKFASLMRKKGRISARVARPARAFFPL